jgi:acyl-CoA thioester hydrolase
MLFYSRTYELRWSDADANGHIRHSVYSELGAEVRIAWFADCGYPWARFGEIGLGPVLLREELEYRREIGLGERVRIDLQAAGLSPDAARWKIRHDLFKADGQLAARIGVLGGWIDLARRRLVRPPEDLAAVLRGAARAAEFEELPPLTRREE